MKQLSTRPLSINVIKTVRSTRLWGVAMCEKVKRAELRRQRCGARVENEAGGGATACSHTLQLQCVIINYYVYILLTVFKPEQDQNFLKLLTVE